jgi:hypothetical protein
MKFSRNAEVPEQNLQNSLRGQEIYNCKDFETDNSLQLKKSWKYVSQSYT